MNIWSVNKTDIERAGEWFVWGSLRSLGRAFAIGLLTMVVFATALDLTGRIFHVGPVDDSDGSWSDRSNMKPRRDALTGCEYLESVDGNLTPRLGRDGRQICR